MLGVPTNNDNDNNNRDERKLWEVTDMTVALMVVITPLSMYTLNMYSCIQLYTNSSVVYIKYVRFFYMSVIPQ